MNVPSNLKYSRTHEWVEVKGASARIGITDFAQKELGDIVYIELPKIGQKIKAEESCAVVESVKAASDIYAPLSGTVAQINENLQKETAVVNQDAYGQGWFFEIHLDDVKETEGLLNASDYQELIGVEA